MESYHRGSDTEEMMMISMISKVIDAMHTSFDIIDFCIGRSQL